MKLYTEEQVREMLKSTHIHTDKDVDMIFRKFTPIELPSRDMADVASLTNSAESKIDFINGFIWTIRQILNQNK